MNQEEFNKHLADNETSETQGKIVNMVIQSMKESGGAMSEYHDSWEQADRIYRGYRQLDKQDGEAISKNQPPKVIIPVSYALTQTALSFLMTTFFTDERLFKLLGRGPEDQRVKEAYELDINFQLSKEKAYLKIYLWLQDAFKYGIGITEDCWETQTQKMRTQKVEIKEPGMVATLLGRGPTQEMVETVADVVTFEGTKLKNISPFNFYPDPSVPVSQFQEGAFCACEDETSKAEMAMGEGSLYFGTEHIPQIIPSSIFNQRSHRVGMHSVFKNTGGGLPEDKKMEGAVIKIRYEFVSTPREILKTYDLDVGNAYDKDSPFKMVAVIANDQKLVKFEPLGYLHNKFGFNVIEYSPDHNSFINPGLSDTIYNLQDIMTWFLNSHVQNVRKAIRNRFIGDPERIHVSDLTSGKEFIRTKAMSGRSITDAIYSLDVNDVTRGHVGDLQVLNSLIQIVTGINENALGQYTTGRRSATEARSVSSAASARLKMHGMIAWTQGLEPLAQKVIANTNQLRSKEYYEKMLGEDSEKYPYEKTIVADPMVIANGFNFLPYEGSLPNDKEREAQHFTNLVEAILRNPRDMVALTNTNLSKVLEHIFSLYGVKNFKDYQLNPQQLNQSLQATVVPDAALAEMEQRQQVAPVQMPGDLASALGA
jgi:hypothetical protein